ncbi:hypothetical protein, partial [Brucella gallinifaecis]|uniref:hypothetical protein n=1 Tax=Brucella gallinifaecis TaxID=215590 RepID=UPI00236221CE
ELGDIGVDVVRQRCHGRQAKDGRCHHVFHGCLLKVVVVAALAAISCVKCRHTAQDGKTYRLDG